MFDTRELRMISAWSIGLGALLVFALVSCGGSGTKHDHTAAQPPPTEPSTTTARLPAQIPSAGAVPMTPTPRAALARCRQSKLLRPICPQRIPLSLHSAAYDLADGCANAPHITIASRRCTLPGWSYESSAPLPGVPTKGSEQVSAWDGTEWFVPSYSPRTPPPYLVHVDIGAAAGPAAVMVADLGRPQHVDRVTDALLNRDRAPRAVSFGRVRWYGRPGELLLAGGGANGGGEEAGHVIFAFTAGGIGYDISLHAWASKERITVHGVTYVVTAPQPGPALPHVIATLKAIVGSTPQG